MKINEEARLRRQLDIIPLRVLDNLVHVVGAGGLGSAIALSLSKMGFKNIHVWDFDTVDIENLNAQMYRVQDLGRPKVEALVDICREFSSLEVTPHNEKVRPDELDGIIVSALDSMKVRKEIWEAVSKKDIRLLIDPRLGGEYACCYTAIVGTEFADSYQNTLYPDSEAEELPCTAKSTMYIAFAMAAHVSKVIKDFLVNKNNNHVYSMQWDFKTNEITSFMTETGSTNLLLRANS